MVPRLYLWRALTVLWALHIFWMSTESFGSSQSRFFLAGIFDFLHITVSLHTLDVGNTIVRKLAHLSEYGVFGFLLYRSFGGQDGLRWDRAISCMLIASAYSLTDEFHQLFVPGRGPSLVDCAIDVSGTALALLMIYGFSRVAAKGHRAAAK